MDQRGLKAKAEATSGDAPFRHACPGQMPEAPLPFSLEQAEYARRFHMLLPGYAPTPMRSLPELACSLGFASIHVKDESFRFGLESFKPLGASYCVGKLLAERYGLSDDEISFAALRKAGGDAAPLTFASATDGNHGRGVAWSARIFGHKSRVYLPRGSAEARLRHIREQGGEAAITSLNYDDTVRYVCGEAGKHGWILAQDTSWPGYEEIPRLIMTGYATMAMEAAEQLEKPPTHVFLQAGVGAMACAVASFFHLWYGSDCPKIIIVEPDAADCIFRSAAAGQSRKAAGNLATIMAGLACGEPCGLAWPVLARHGSHFFAVPDSAAEEGMRILGKPLGADPVIVSGESGAAPIGLLARLAACGDICGLDGDSRILCISTEGATDPDSWQRVMNMQ